MCILDAENISYNNEDDGNGTYSYSENAKELYHSQFRPRVTL